MIQLGDEWFRKYLGVCCLCALEHEKEENNKVKALLIMTIQNIRGK
jgi:hypothetical protein